MGRCNSECSALGHGVPCIKRQVHNHLLELASVSKYKASLLVEHELKTDLGPHHRYQETLHTLDHLIDINIRRSGRLLFAEGEELSDECRCRLLHIPDFPDILCDRLGIVDLDHHEFGKPFDGCQIIIEVMCDTPCKPANCLHLLGTKEFTLKVLVLGDITAQPQDAFLAVQSDCYCGPQHCAQFSGLCSELDLLVSYPAMLFQFPDYPHTVFGFLPDLDLQ